MLTPLTKRNIARDRFGASASVYGTKGGKVCSEKKKAAGANSLRIARYTKMVKAAERGEMFKVVSLREVKFGQGLFDTLFVGSMPSCARYCRSNNIPLKDIRSACVSDVPKP